MTSNEPTSSNRWSTTINSFSQTSLRSDASGFFVESYQPYTKRTYLDSDGDRHGVYLKLLKIRSNDR